jgi:L-alanine-DL-glutamate epimerase-like enolase superfamily enzyme
MVNITTRDGFTGYGEGVPREFVTGESIADSFHMIHDNLMPGLGDMNIEHPDQVWSAINDLIQEPFRIAAPAACCALEMAILDCAGKRWQCSLADFLPPVRSLPRYSAVLPLTRPEALLSLLEQTRRLAIAQIKLKVGGDDDRALVGLTREILGADVDIRLDANGAWSASEAADRIADLLPYGISAIEQPVAKTDFEGMRSVTRAIPIPVIADESLCTWEDAARLIDMGACQMFNIRISKCGGLHAAMRLYDYAQSNGIQSMLGCQVGETGILSAAGRHLAAAHDFQYLEGAYGTLLLEQDVVEETVAFGKGGKAEPLSGRGLGVTVKKKVFDHYTIDRSCLTV